MGMEENQYLESIAALMKRGRSDEIGAFFEKPPVQQEETFYSYIHGLIDKSGMSKAKIISQVGLSTDYMYKVLRGAKRTEERDYIIAVCLSMKANVLETQRALELYPFPILDSNDMRSAIILTAINESVDRYILDEWLRKVNLPLLKISPDMPSVKIGPVRSTHISESLIKSETDEGQEPSKQRRFVEMEITDTFQVAEQFGNAPFDYFYLAEYELTDEEGKKVYVAANFWPDGSSAFGVTSRSIQEDIDEEDPDFMIENYETLEEAAESAFFPYFLDLDKLTDRMAADQMAELNDTKTYGFRLGADNVGGKCLIHAEAYNNQNPEYNEYLQIRETPEGVIFSMSHKSYFMQMELNGPLDYYYRQYFGEPEEQLYVFEANSLDELGTYECFRPAFEYMIKLVAERTGKKIMGGKE